MIEIRRYAESKRDEWDACVQASRNGTLFHTWKFLSYHPKERFEDHSLLFFEGNRLLAVLPAAIEDTTTLRSHPGSTYGGLVFSSKCSTAATFEIIRVLAEYARAQEFKEISFLRLTPFPLRKAFSDDQEYVLLTQGFSTSRSELGSIIDLHELTEDTLLSSFDTQCRNEVRQAERAGITIRVCDEYDAFYPLLEATLKHRHDVKPTHSLSELKKLAALFPRAIRLFGAYSKNTLIAGMVIMDVTEHAMYVKYIAQDYTFQKLRPVNLLIAEVLCQALRENKTILDLGVSMDENSPEGINKGLFAFKEGFGARPVRRESFTWKI